MKRLKTEAEIEDGLRKAAQMVKDYARKEGMELAASASLEEIVELLRPKFRAINNFDKVN